ncbi:hypothetical protein CPB84DRAFT_1754931 [Gymnopilus junonius]|uniref:Histone deacetylase interacting domain-containing protein n=1 Tax=Gymnopilus junonius TaxID=109634 RepID=A0A9P5TEK2_GYMJU|nr:hypothetical protein CPB84DRAFT_1754931 [Gymnopilus junonius]
MAEHEPAHQRSRRGSPMDPHSYSSLDRPLNVADALTYLDAVKVQFQDQPDVYNHFLDIMKEFKNEQQVIDTPGVIKRVSHLFNGHPSLIQGFNTFLPVGYRIECSMDPHDAGFITVTTPSGTTLHTTNNGPGRALTWSSAPSAPPPRHDPSSGYFGPNDHGALAPPPVPSPDPRTYGMDGQAIEPAVQYVQKIKQRCDPETYRQFLDILSRYHHKPDTIDEEEVSRQIARLFKDAPDLRADFRVFMPDRSQQLMDDVPSHARDREKNRRNKLDVAASPMNVNAQPATSQKRKRKAPEKDREREKGSTPAKVVPPPAKKPKHAAPAQDLTPVSYNPKHVVASNAAVPPAASSSPRRSHHALPATQQHPQSSLRATAAPHPSDDTHFFDRVKHALDNRDLYNEFLKLVNLFAQDYIDTARLVKESKNFLGNTELYKQFREILGWDEKKEREHFLKDQNERSGWAKPAIVALPERPGRVDLSEKYGSYRRVSPSVASMTCSGRDEMCRSVLNDDWVSLPSWTSEDSGFIFHRKNIYEEALHRSEEERHEYDFHIEAITRTIAMLEPFNNNKLACLPTPEDGKPKPTVAGSWKAIHQRVIKKIYGREAGLQVVAALHEQPLLAVPVVLARLKQKEEEWKRAQREWNKVWRDVDARNYLKSLDHQAVMWKVKEKKALGVKSLVYEIETAREEQHSKRAALVDRTFERTRPRYHLAFAFGEDEAEGEKGEKNSKGKEKEKDSKEKNKEAMGILQDAIKLVFSFLDRTSGQISGQERKRIENFLRVFVPLFFSFGSVEFNSGLLHHETIVESENEAVSDTNEDTESAALVPPAPTANTSTSSANGKGRGGRKHQSNHSSGDLRKKLLKSEQAKSTSGRKTRGGASPAVSRFASPVVFGSAGEEAALAGLDVMFVFPPGAGKRSSKINNVFFSNTTFYVLMRLIEILYSRLRLFKGLSAELARKAEEKTKASTSSSANSASPSAPIVVDKKHYYDILLGQCEAVFMNELEQHVFEEQTRVMFGYKDAYKIFTIDKVIGGIIKQAQNVVADPKSQELLELLKRERSLMTPTTQDRTNYRHQVENILGPDENVFRIDWLSQSKTMTIQLIGRDDATFDDSEALSGRWQTYIDAYVSADSTEGILQSRVRRPYLRRNLPAAIRETQPDVSSRDGMEIKVCVRTYRLFYVPKTGDLMWKHRSKEEMEKNAKQLKTRNRLRRKWLEVGVDKLGPEAVGSVVEAAQDSGDAQTEIQQTQSASEVEVIPTSKVDAPAPPLPAPVTSAVAVVPILTPASS